MVSEFSALDEDTLTLAAANGTINLRTKGNRPDDTYVMWVGTPQFSHPDDGVQPTAPFPAQVATVASSISGTLWWDDNHDAAIGVDERRIGGVTVSLWRAQPDGSRADDKPLRTVTSDTNGAYRFDGVRPHVRGCDGRAGLDRHPDPG